MQQTHCGRGAAEEFAYSAEAQNGIAASFQNELGRAATANDIAFWENRLAGGASTFASMRAAFAQSPEATSTIQGDYAAVLGRSGSAAEVAFWQNYLANGGNLPAIRGALAYSGEAQNDINTLFENVLGQEATADDLTVWENHLATDTTLANVRAAIATTAIETLFRNELGRDATSLDQAFWQSHLGTDTTFASMRTALAQSADAASALQNIYAAVLGRSASADEAGFWQNYLINGGSLSDIQGALAYSNEAQNNIAADFQDELGRTASGDDVAFWENALASGSASSWSMRTSFASSAEAQNDIAADFQNELGRAANGGDVAFWEYALASGSDTFANMRTEFAQSADAANAIQNIYAAVLGRGASADDVGNWQNDLINGGSLSDIRGALAYSDEAATDISTIVAAVGGLDTDPASLATLEAALSAGATLASLWDVFGRADEAGRGGVLIDAGLAAATAFYHAVLGRDPSLDEVAGMEAALAANIAPDTPIAVLDQQGNLLGQATADKLMVELPVFVTLNNGATPTLLLPGGTALTDGAQVAACLLGLEGRAGRLDATAIATYGQIMGWLDQIGQQLLQLAATVASWAPLETDRNRRAIDSEIVKLALQLAALPPALRAQQGSETERIALTGHKTDVSVFFNGDTGQWTYGVHDISNGGIFGYVLQGVAIVATAVATILSDGATTPLLAEEIATGIAVTADAAIAAQSFAQGNVLGGLLSLAAAVGVGLQGFGSAAQGAAANSQSVFGLSATEAADLTNTGKLVQAASQVVGGTASTIQGIETGDTLGISGGLLEVAAGAAGGKVTLDGRTASVALKVVSLALNSAATATNISDAITHGRIADALLASLGPLINSIAALTQSGNPGALSDGSEAPAVIPVNWTVPVDGIAADSLIPVLLRAGIAVLEALPIVGGLVVAAVSAYELTQTTSTPIDNGSGPPLTGEINVHTGQVLLYQPAGPGGAPLPGTSVVSLTLGVDGGLYDGDDNYVGQVRNGRIALIDSVLPGLMKGGTVYDPNAPLVLQSKLGDNLKAAGETKSAPDDQAHHVVPQGGPQNGNRNPETAQEKLAEVGIGKNDAENGVWLSPEFHSQLHDKAYYDYVNNLFSGASTKEEVEQDLSDLKNQLKQADQNYQKTGQMPSWAKGPNT